MGSFSTPLSGLTSAQQQLQNVSNNLANIDTNGYKSQTLTFSDIFFAEIRPFERIFRPDQSGASESQMDQNPGQGQGQGQGGGQQNSNLAELQKQIVTATWKLQQSKPPATQERKP